jgi:predicted O-methyltransferase YrrM
MSSPDDLERELRETFKGAARMVPAYHSDVGRALMPNWEQEALLVPLDWPGVVNRPLGRHPYDWLMERLTAPAHVDRFRSFAALMGKCDGDFRDVPTHETDTTTPYIENGYFHLGDALALTAMICQARPKQYVEIGSGNSTRFARRAIARYQARTKITCIDPNPRASVKGIADEWMPESVLHTPMHVFENLEPGDILFLDGSHLMFDGTDTEHILLRVYPRLKPGVIIHVHDIFLPYAYPSRCDHLYWNEQHALASLLLHKPMSDVLAPVHFMWGKGLIANEGVSFWLKR